MLKMADTSLHALSYDDAWLYCATCTHDNKYDWRLPTHYEYRTNQLRNIYNGKIRAYPVRDCNAN
jgi:hypothetical protein